MSPYHLYLFSQIRLKQYQLLALRCKIINSEAELCLERLNQIKGKKNRSIKKSKLRFPKRQERQYEANLRLKWKFFPLKRN